MPIERVRRRGNSALVLSARRIKIVAVIIRIPSVLEIMLRPRTCVVISPGIPVVAVISKIVKGNVRSVPIWPWSTSPLHQRVISVVAMLRSHGRTGIDHRSIKSCSRQNQSKETQFLQHLYHLEMDLMDEIDLMDEMDLTNVHYVLLIH